MCLGESAKAHLIARLLTPHRRYVWCFTGFRDNAAFTAALDAVDVSRSTTNTTVPEVPTSAHALVHLLATGTVVVTARHQPSLVCPDELLCDSVSCLCPAVLCLPCDRATTALKALAASLAFLVDNKQQHDTKLGVAASSDTTVEDDEPQGVNPFLAAVLNGVPGERVRRYGMDVHPVIRRWV